MPINEEGQGRSVGQDTLSRKIVAHSVKKGRDKNLGGRSSQNENVVTDKKDKLSVFEIAEEPYFFLKS